jgi:acetyl esterase/lipase
MVLNYHGLGSKDDVATAVVSQAAATNGFVVYTPSWVGDQFPFTPAVFDAWKDRASCSVAFAQEHAAANGGDATNTVLYGFSAGVGPVMFASQQPRTGPIDGCATSTSPMPPVSAILGDGPYFLHDPGFDEPFALDPAGMQSEVTALVDPANWPTDLDAKFFMWMPENDTGPRPIEDGSDWLSSRDADGSIRADLDELGMLDDGIISNRDAARLLALRLTDAGLDVTLDEYPGAHTTWDKALELVGYMQAALDQ